MPHDLPHVTGFFALKRDSFSTAPQRSEWRHAIKDIIDVHEELERTYARRSPEPTPPLLGMYSWSFEKPTPTLVSTYHGGFPKRTTAQSKRSAQNKLSRENNLCRTMARKVTALAKRLHPKWREDGDNTDLRFNNGIRKIAQKISGLAAFKASPIDVTEIEAMLNWAASVAGDIENVARCPDFEIRRCADRVLLALLQDMGWDPTADRQPSGWVSKVRRALKKSNCRMDHATIVKTMKAAAAREAARLLPNSA